MKKLLLLAAAGAGYVLGARAGRERYDEIADRANKLWNDPRVQEKVEEVKVKGPEMAQKVGDQAKHKAEEFKTKTSGSEGTGSGDETQFPGDHFENQTGSVHQDGSLEVDSTTFGPGGEKLP